MLRYENVAQVKDFPKNYSLQIYLTGALPN